MPQLWGAVYAGGYKPFDFRIERLIAFARAALAVFALIAIYLDPADPAENVQAIYIILAVYLTLALIIVWVVIAGHLRAAWHLPIHLADIGLISVLMYLSKGSASPFFVFYTFVLLAATLRWNLRGAVGTSILLIVLLVVLVWTTQLSLARIIDDPNFELNRTIIQVAFVLVAGGMLAAFGASREQGHNRLEKLAAWPSPTIDISETGFGLSSAVFSHVAAVTGAPRVLVLWKQSEQPHLNIISWADGRCKKEDRLLENTFGDQVAPELSSIAFASNDIHSKNYIVAERSRGCKVPLVNPKLADQFHIGGVASAAFSGAVCRGRVYLLDRSDWREDDLTLTEIIASRIGMELEHYVLRHQLESAATVRERVRVARDLHDGILQSLTAAGLQIKTAMSRTDAATRQLLENLGHLLSDEQRQVREFIEEWRPKSPLVQRDFHLNYDTQRLLNKLNRLWDCEMDLTVLPEDAKIPSKLGSQLDFILAESVANSIQHGHASRVAVTIEKSPEHLLLRICDNGHGYQAVTGTHEHAQLVASDIGPRSLRNRIAELGGSLSLSSSPQGVELGIRLPL